MNYYYSYAYIFFRRGMRKNQGEVNMMIICEIAETRIVWNRALYYNFGKYLSKGVYSYSIQKCHIIHYFSTEKIENQSERRT